MTEYVEKDLVISKIAEKQVKVATGIEDVTYYRAIKIIRDAPAADVQPVHYARWIDLDNRIMCSGCGVGYDDDDKVKRSTYLFCSNCGAKMVLE